MPPEKLIKVGSVIGAHGIRGEFKLLSFLEDPESITGFSLLDAKGMPLFSLTITGRQKDALIVKASGVTDRNAAERLKGKELYIPAAALPALDDNEHYHNDLINLPATLANNEPFGIVKAIYNFGAGDVVEIALPDGKTEMLPLEAPWVVIEKHCIIVTMPEYLQVR